MADPFVFTPEQRELRSVVRDFCAAHSDEPAVRRLMESTPAYDPKVWGRLGAELGVLGLGVPEELGGSGGGVVDAAVLVEELGAALFCGPVLGTLGLAIPALVAAPASEVRSALLGALVDGSRRAAFAVPDRVAVPAVEDVKVQAACAGDQWTVNGPAGNVPDASAADDLVVAAIGPQGLVLLVVDSAAAGVERTPMTTLDLTRPQASIRFDGASGQLLAEGPDAVRACRRAFQVGAVLLAAEQVGGAQYLLDLSVSYAGTRLQFGRAIGSFQAVKHRLADMYVDLEHARSAAYHAAWALADDTDDADLAVSIAQAACSAAYTRIAKDAIQVHGGIGFTWEHQAHLYFKRAFTDAALLGSAEQHRSRIAELVLDAAAGGRPVAVAHG